MRSSLLLAFLLSGCLGNRLSEAASKIEYLDDGPDDRISKCTPITQLTGFPAYWWSGGKIGAIDGRRDVRNQALAWDPDLMVENGWTSNGTVTATAYKCPAIKSSK